MQRQSAVTAQSITDALVVQVQELHFAGLAREEEFAAAALVADAPGGPPVETEFMREYQQQTATLQRSQQTVDQLTLLLGRSQSATEALIAASPKPGQSSPGADWPSRPDPPQIPQRAVAAGERWLYAPPPVKAAVAENVGPAGSFEARPPWSKSMATSFDSTMTQIEPPLLAVRRCLFCQRLGTIWISRKVMMCRARSLVLPWTKRTRPR